MIRLSRILPGPYSRLYSVFLRALNRLDRARAARLAGLLIPALMLPFRSQLRSNLECYWGSQSHYLKDNFRSLRKAHMRHLALLTVAFARLPGISSAELGRDTELVGEEHLREALKCGRGALLVMDHFGNGWHSLAALSSRGYRITLLMNTMLLPVMERHVVKICRRFMISVISPHPDAFRQAREVLKRNELFLLAYDASVPSRNCIWIPFGMSFVRAHLGTAVLALRSHAPVMRVTNRVLPSGQSRSTIAPPLSLPAGSEPRTDAASLLTAWVRELDAETILHPEQWCLWSHVALGEKPGAARNFAPPQPDRAGLPGGA